MSEVFNFLIDILDEMRKDLHIRAEEIQVYAGKEIYGDLRAQRDTRPRSVPQDNPPGSGSVSMTPEVDTKETYVTTEAIRAHGLKIFEEPRLGRQEIILLHEPGIERRSEELAPWIRHPDAIQRFTMSEMASLSNCRYCGDSSEYAIEGDDGEPYCSLTCLHEAYQ